MTASDADVEAVGRAIADADGEDYMEDCERYDARARAAIAADPSRKRMAEALRECRQELADQIEADVDHCCPHNEDGTPNESEMDELSRPMIEASRALLARIEAALDGGGQITLHEDLR